MIKKFLNRTPIYNFNLVERDKWIEKQAKNIPPNSKVLDVGAGSSPYKNQFAHCEYKTQDFCQLLPNQLRFENGYAQIDYVSAAHEITVASGTFDVIICTEVLEHVHNPIEVVNEIGRILKPGGKLILTAPLGSGLHQQPYHFYGGYTPFWYDKFLTLAEFKDICVVPNGRFFKFYGQESQHFIKHSAPWNIKAHVITKIIWSLLWVILFPILWFGLPLLCYFIDSWDTFNMITVGYHVTATKNEH